MDLTDRHIQLLSCGLKFCPTQDFRFHKDLLSDFHKRLKRIVFFYHKEKKNSTNNIIPATIKLDSRSRPIRSHSEKLNNLKLPSDFLPPIEFFDQEFLDLLNYSHKKLSKLARKKNFTNFLPNLNSGQFSALVSLIKLLPSVIIKPADKGSGIVILDRKDYITEVHRQLSNKLHYCRMPYSISRYRRPYLHSVYKELLFKKLITKKTFDFLLSDLKPVNSRGLPAAPKSRRYYALPKIHKDPNKWPVPFKSPPPRPIISDCGSDSYNLAHFIDLHLAPFCSNHSSYIKDSYDFLEKTSKLTIPPNTFFITLDVNALYTNIDVNDCIMAIEAQMSKNPHPIHSYILHLLRFSFAHNDFVFNDEWFLQLLGASMGKRWSPRAADCFVARLEAKALNLAKPYVPEAYFRFLDDCDLFWSLPLHLFFRFFRIMNSISPFISFTYNIHAYSTDFLDITIHKGQRFDFLKHPDFKLYRKSTDTFDLLSPLSYHPAHTFSAIPYSQLLRFTRICSSPSDFLVAAKHLHTTLTSQGYPSRDIVKTTNILLRKKYGLTINNLQPLNKNVLISYFSTLDYSKLKKIMYWTKLPDTPPATAHSPGNCVYAVCCVQCNAIYVGLTTNLLSRWHKHLSDIRLNKDTPVAKHFNTGDPTVCESDVCQPILCLLETGILKKELELREIFWIHNIAQVFNLLNEFIPKPPSTLPIILKYAPASLEFNKHMAPLIKENPSLQDPMKNYQLVAAYQRHENLRDLLCPAVLPLENISNTLPKSMKQTLNKIKKTVSH